MRTLVWFRNDLRTVDHPALHAAAEAGPVIACFLVAADQWRAHGVSAVRLNLLERTLGELAADLSVLNIPLVVRDAPRFADAPAALVTLAKEVGAARVAFNLEYPLDEERRDARVCAALRDAGIESLTYHAELVHPPGTVVSKAGEPFSVFSAFKRRWLALTAPGAVEPLPAPAPQNITDVATDLIPRLTLETVPEWPAGQRAALQRLNDFIEAHGEAYAATRDHPAQDGTSRLSPQLAVGSLSPRQCLHAAVRANGGQLTGGVDGLDQWITELVWREFYRHVVSLFPHVSRGCAFNQDMDRLAWRDAPAELAAWCEGRTGYPLVDAAMRELNRTGWMHNRLRMVTAMFLTKHLLIDWRLGERYFMEHLVDGDFASNNGGWQWSASTGTDAAPYFRIFNPTLQGRRFDPDGTFTRAVLPVLDEVPTKLLFEPWRHEKALDYPPPIVEHRFARQRALEFFKSSRAS